MKHSVNRIIDIMKVKLYEVILFLDLSHNKIGDGGARALGKLLVSKCRLKSLNVANNQIGSHGGGAIGHALQKNSKLLSLNLRLNRLSDEGGFGILKALLKNATLTTLHLGSNELGELSAQAMNEVDVVYAFVFSLLSDIQGQKLSNYSNIKSNFLQLD